MVKRTVTAHLPGLESLFVAVIVLAVIIACKVSGLFTYWLHELGLLVAVPVHVPVNEETTMQVYSFHESFSQTELG